MKSHPARILLLIGFALFIIMLFMLISCNTIPDKYQVQHDTGVLVYRPGEYVRILSDTTYISKRIPHDTIYIFIHDTTYIIQEVSK